MRALMLAASVALAIPASPAFAGDSGPVSRLDHVGSASNGFGVAIHRGDSGRRGRGGNTVIVDGGGYYYGGEWARYNNRTFESDSYNDWWHDNPERSYPRWVTRGDCARQWYAGDTLRC